MSDPSVVDIDPVETAEWLSALADVLKHDGPERASYLLTQLYQTASQAGASCNLLNTAYCNTLTAENSASFPGDEVLEQRLTELIRWNAMAMVVRAGKYAAELGGHIATYASSASLYEVAFNHFFRAGDRGDLVYFQGHSSPGIYARSFLAGDLSVSHLQHFRQESAGRDHGLSSYPHPWLMPDYWQFATVSMGLGPIQAIYQARFLKYLHHRKLLDTAGRKVWCFCGDGEMDEPESLGAIGLASREQLDNLIFVINCNLQRLDGPVRGNGQIIAELERIFRGAGWNIIKVIWGREWDALLARDRQGLLLKRMSEVVDGEYQTYRARDGAYLREHFFGKYPELLALVADYSDEQLQRLNLGGHDIRKIYAGYQQACAHRGQPTVVLARTVKGYGMGVGGEAQNITHNVKKLEGQDLLEYRTRYNIPLSDDEAQKATFYRPADDSAEIQYLKAQRKKLDGSFPARRLQADEKLTVPAWSEWQSYCNASDRPISTTMAFVRFITQLLKDKNMGSRVVPILADESRTFGMEGLFRQIGIYSPQGQNYQPVDAGQVMYYRESQEGQLLQEGLSEAGAFCSWLAAATSYSSNNLPMLPFFIYYSMFGFQRIGDLIWAAGDMRARGFLLGATAGRTTLAGEGLQHQDGHSHLMATQVPNCIAYDPCFAYELVTILHEGMVQMAEKERAVFYYITVMNENYIQRAMPENAREGIIKGMYLLQEGVGDRQKRVQLLGSGAILNEVIRAAELLQQDWQISADVFSVTSFNELARDGMRAQRMQRLQNKNMPTHLSACLSGCVGPVIAATDYMRLYAEQIRPYLGDLPYYTLGTDGFGRSDTRKALRQYFEVQAEMIVYTSLYALAQQKRFDSARLPAVAQQYQLDLQRSPPWET